MNTPELTEDTVESQATRLAHTRAFASRRKDYMHSHEGYNAAIAGFDEIRLALESGSASIRTASGVAVTTKSGGPKQMGLVGAVGASITLQGMQYTNVAENIRVEVKLWRGHPPIQGPNLSGRRRYWARARFGSISLLKGQDGAQGQTTNLVGRR